VIKNTTNKKITNIEYLDTIPQIFSSEKTMEYRIKIGDKNITRKIEPLSTGEYDIHFTG